MTGIIPTKTIDDIRFHTDIVDLIGRYINLKKAGPTYKALCPFHKEKTPSFTVNAQKQFFYCFGCQAGGDVFSFVMKYEGVDYLTAVKILAERAGISIEYEKGASQSDDKATLYKIHNEVTKFYRDNLVNSPHAEVARQYLVTRQISEQTAEEFSIGYAPDGWDNIIKWGKKNGFTDKQLKKAGLLTSSENNKKQHLYDRFRNRLMFPIRDAQNRVIGFSGRVLDKNEKGAKYVNSPETPLFHKSKILYALEKARRTIVDKRTAIICEGQIDVIKCHQAEFTNAVASQGTAFTPQHASILHRYADSVIIVFDSDDAGRNAAIKSAALFMDAGLAVKIALLPPGEDPDSLITKQGPDAFKNIINNTMTAIAFQVNVLSQRENINSEEGIMRIADEVLTTIAQSPNAIQRSKLLQEAAIHLKVPESSLNEELRKKIHRKKTPEYSSAPATSNTQKYRKTKPLSIPQEESMLCKHLTTATPEIIELTTKYLPLKILSNQSCIDYANACILAEGNQQELQNILNNLSINNPDFTEFIASIQSSPIPMHGSEFTVTDAVKGLILATWRKKLKTERKALSSGMNEKRAMLTYDIHALNNWQNGSLIIEREMQKENEEEF